MGRIDETFARLRQQGRAGLVTFLTAGDPNLERCERLVAAVVEAGADIIELGMPFSDPMADGPVIQAASQRALEAGTTLAGVLELVTRLRRRTQAPIVLMGYYNPVFSFGVENFARQAAAAGVDGVLLVDLPAEESEEIRPFLRQAGIDLIQLIAPTTPPSRRLALARGAEGFVYFVSMTGVTGSQEVDPTAIREMVTALRQSSPVPVAVGFGITTARDAAAVGAFADAVVVGSALVRQVEAAGEAPDLESKAADFVRTLAQALNGSRQG